jgi:ribosomal protein L11 methyltransferase
VAAAKYHVVTVPYQTPGTRALEDLVEHVAFVDLACDGIEGMNLDEARVNEILWERAVGGGEIPMEIIQEVEDAGSKDPRTVSRFFFHGKDSAQRAKKFLGFVTENITPAAVCHVRSWQDWNRIWRRSFAPINVTERVAVYPEWYREGRVAHPDPIFIYPGMGFGTGGHETTHMCLELLDRIVPEIGCPMGPSCLDFGCGSGILGIAAMKYANAHADFCDIDRSALDNCVQNLNLNFSVEEIMERGKKHGREIQLISRQRFSAGRAYDLVFANILENILVEEKDTLVRSLAQGGHLILSGLLNPQAKGILKLYTEASTGLSHVASIRKGDWSAILLVKK